MLRLTVGLILLATAAHASILCVKPQRNGTLNGPVRVRDACKPGERQLSASEVGFCCTATTTTTTTATCPTFTTTTLGAPNCGGFGTFCGGFCPNAHQCVSNPTTNACECTGPLQPCGVVSAAGTCGGSCPAGQTCQLYSPTQSDGCPDYPRCACVLAP